MADRRESRRGGLPPNVTTRPASFTGDSSLLWGIGWGIAIGFVRAVHSHAPTHAAGHRCLARVGLDTARRRCDRTGWHPRHVRVEGTLRGGRQRQPRKKVKHVDRNLPNLPEVHQPFRMEVSPLRHDHAGLAFRAPAAAAMVAIGEPSRAAVEDRRAWRPRADHAAGFLLAVSGDADESSAGMGSNRSAARSGCARRRLRRSPYPEPMDSSCSTRAHHATEAVPEWPEAKGDLLWMPGSTSLSSLQCRSSPFSSGERSSHGRKRQRRRCISRRRRKRMRAAGPVSKTRSPGCDRVGCRGRLPVAEWEAPGIASDAADADGRELFSSSRLEPGQ